MHYFRYHDKVIIEEELNQVRKEQNAEWEIAKHHLKLAKKYTSLENFNREKTDVISLLSITTILNSNRNSNGYSDPGMRINHFQSALHFLVIFIGSEWNGNIETIPGTPCSSTFV